MKNNFIAYKGDKFEIEWYFDSRGRSDSRDYFLETYQLIAKRSSFIYCGTLETRVKSLISRNFAMRKIKYAIKPAPDRFLCFFFEGSKIIVTNAYEKKTKKMPPREKEKALKARADYIQRCNKETYYDEKN